MDRKYNRDRDQRDRKPRVERTDIIFGVRAVIEAVRANKELNKILIQKGMNKELFLELKEELKGKDYALQFVPVQKLNSLTDKNHQGVVAEMSPATYYNIEEVVEELMEEGKKPFILALDRVTDVRNFGAIARSAECMGVDAILIPSKGSALITGDAIKTSAGALNRLKVCKATSFKDAIFYMQQSGLRIVACTEKSSVPLHEANLRGSVAVIMGSEENGITQDLINLSDVACKIPMRGKIASLNVSVAAGMVLYEKLRQEIY